MPTMLRLALPALISFAALHLVALAVPPLGWPTGSVRHKFHDTPNGQIHYVVSGDLTTGVPMVLFHSHPRSSAEFRYLIEDLKGKSAFLAIDWFGMGFSDDYKPHGDEEFGSFEAMAKYVLEIATTERLKQFVSVGNLKGAHPAIELAALAGAHRVKGLVLINPLILSPTAEEFISSKLVPMMRNQSLSVDGSHLISAWNDTSSAPMGPAGIPWNNQRDLVANQEKTNDELRCLSTGWQYDAAWAAYNGNNEPRMALVDTYAKSLFLYGTGYIADCKMFGLDPQFSLDAFARSLTHEHNTTHFLEGGTQGMLVQNSTLIADYLSQFQDSLTASIVL